MHHASDCILGIQSQTDDIGNNVTFGKFCQLRVAFLVGHARGDQLSCVLTVRDGEIILITKTKSKTSQNDVGDMMKSAPENLPGIGTDQSLYPV